MSSNQIIARLSQAEAEAIRAALVAAISAHSELAQPITAERAALALGMLMLAQRRDDDLGLDGLPHEPPPPPARPRDGATTPCFCGDCDWGHRRDAKEWPCTEYWRRERRDMYQKGVPA